MIKKICIGLVYSIRYSCQIFNGNLIFWQIFKKYWYVRFHENPSSGSGVITCGRKDRHTHMTKPIVAFRHFAKVP